jgi:hypothetical protein
MARYFLLVSVMALAVNGGAVFAQPAVDTTTTTQSTTIAPPIAPPPAGTLATTHEHIAVDGNGNATESKTKTYRETNGYAQDRSTTTITPPPPMVTTTTQTETTTSGPQ